MNIDSVIMKAFVTRKIALPRRDKRNEIVNGTFITE